MDTTRRNLISGVTSIAAATLISPVRAASSGKVEFMKAVVPKLRKPQPQCIDLNGHRVCKITYFPTIIPFGDWDYYYTNSVTQWDPNPGQQYEKVVVPKGFVTDLASIPQILWNIIPPTGRYAYAAIVHDYLYWFQPTSREVADKILAIAMGDSGVGLSKRQMIYDGVRVGGQSAWDANKKARDNGEKRILKEFPDDRLMSWGDWKMKPNVFSE